MQVVIEVMAASVVLVVDGIAIMMDIQMQQSAVGKIAVANAATVHRTGIAMKTEEREALADADGSVKVAGILNPLIVDGITDANLNIEQ